MFCNNCNYTVEVSPHDTGAGAGRGVAVEGCSERDGVWKHFFLQAFAARGGIAACALRLLLFSGDGKISFKSNIRDPCTYKAIKLILILYTVLVYSSLLNVNINIKIKYISLSYRNLKYYSIYRIPVLSGTKYFIYRTQNNSDIDFFPYYLGIN